MRLLIEVSGAIDDWHRSCASSQDRPRLPLPFSSSAAFIARGHEVSAINFSNAAFPHCERGQFSHLYGPRQLKAALAENDLAFLWAGSAIRAIASTGLFHRRKIALASYVWQVPPETRSRARALAVATRFAARRARAIVFMTEEQRLQACNTISEQLPVVRFTWGIDSKFYRTPTFEADLSPEIRQAWGTLAAKPYFILAGDQQRLDSDAVRLAEEFNLRLVRVPQEHTTAMWYRTQISERRLQDRLFVFERTSYCSLRFLLQNAVGYLGLVDSTWQPAGWTVLCEAFASGIPAIVYEGLTTREMRRLGAGDYLLTTEHRNLQAVANYCTKLIASWQDRNELSSKAQRFSCEVLDLEKTGAAFVHAIEAVCARRAKRSPKALLANPGTQHSFHLARELDKQGVLLSFYTGFALQKGRLIDRVCRCLPAGVSKRLGNRMLDPFLFASLYRRNWIELVALWLFRRGGIEQRVMHRRNELFQRSVPDTRLEAADVIIGVDTASAILARRCNELNRPFVLDQTIGHPFAKQAMHAAVRRQFPSWLEGFEDRDPDVLAGELSEQENAKQIVIASSFGKRTLIENGVPSAKIEVIPYGVNLDRFKPAERDRSAPFRFVFVGIVTARKGVPLLLEAWAKLNLNDAELWLIGSISTPARAMISRLRGLKVSGAVPQGDVPGILRQCDVFVFPSWYEGFGLVILEAMACGLPVITTTATAGPDIISEGRDGWIIEPGDLDTLLERMGFCLKNRDRIPEMGRAARATAERFTWDAYGKRWVELLHDICSHR